MSLFNNPGSNIICYNIIRLKNIIKSLTRGFFFIYIFISLQIIDDEKNIRLFVIALKKTCTCTLYFTYNYYGDYNNNCVCLN